MVRTQTRFAPVGRNASAQSSGAQALPTTSNQALARMFAPPVTTTFIARATPMQSGGDQRPLSDDEKAYLQRVYGNSLDYDKMTVGRGGMVTAGDTSRTVGNDIHLDDGQFDENGNLTPEGLNTLAHESAHTLQYQQDGAGYAPAALGAQAWAWATTGSRNGAYDWQKRDADGDDFHSWNPEAQAEMAQDYDKMLNQKQQAEDNGEQLSDEDQAKLDRMEQLMQQFRDGSPKAPADGGGGTEGAPGYGPNDGAGGAANDGGGGAGGAPADGGYGGAPADGGGGAGGAPADGGYGGAPADGGGGYGGDPGGGASYDPGAGGASYDDGAGASY